MSALRPSPWLRVCATLLVLLVAGSGGCKKDRTHPAAWTLKPGHQPGAHVDEVRLMGTIVLPEKTPAGEDMHELSGLAWDPEAEALYAISDRGWIFHLRPQVDDDRLVGADITGAFPLRGPDGEPLTGGARDAEGLHLKKPTRGEKGAELYVSFEKQPRVLRTTAEGRYLGKVSIAPRLEEDESYDEDNHALEAVTEHEALGLLLAPERAPPGAKKGHIPLWTAEGKTAGVFVGTGTKRSAVVAFEALEGGAVLLLERDFDRDERRLDSMLYLLRPQAKSARVLPARRILKLSTADGWRHDNYEGLTRHQGQRFFLVSDDNGGHPQRTLLTWIEIPDLSAPGPSAGPPPSSAEEKP